MFLPRSEALTERRYNAQHVLIWGDRGYSHTRVLEDRPSRCRRG